MHKRRWYDAYGLNLCEQLVKLAYVGSNVGTHSLTRAGASSDDGVKTEEHAFVRLLAFSLALLAAVYVVKLFDGNNYPIEWC